MAIGTGNVHLESNYLPNEGEIRQNIPSDISVLTLSDEETENYDTQVGSYIPCPYTKNNSNMKSICAEATTTNNEAILDTKTIQKTTNKPIETSVTVKTETERDSRLPPGYENPFNYSDYDAVTRESSDDEADQTMHPEPQTNVKGLSWKCKICSEIKKDKVSLIEHYEYHKRESDKVQVENEIHYIECPVCHYKFNDVRLYDKHIDSVHRDKGFSCGICNKRYTNTYYFSIHNNECHSSNPDTWICPLCDSSFKTPQEIRQHIEDKHESNKEKYNCEECQKTFTSLTWFNDHKIFHIKSYPYLCTSCNEKFPVKGELIKHCKKIHHRNELTFTKYQCKICKMTFATNQALGNHNNYHNQQTYLCTQCGKIFARRDNLYQHLKNHNESKDYTCYTCGYSFKKKDTLAVHVRIHTGHKPYECKICGKRFNQKSPLRIHMRLHTGERPYKCFRCARGFASKGICDTHTRMCRK